MLLQFSLTCFPPCCVLVQRWVRLRGRPQLILGATVPILKLVHKDGVECDISLDRSHKDNTLEVQEIVERTDGDALRALSAFLKVYLGQLELNATYTGGLGSYKLYGLLADHIERCRALDASRVIPPLGPLLLSFLEYHGTHQEVRSGVKRAFKRAHEILLANQSVENEAGMRAHTFRDNNDISSSALACLLDTPRLFKQRAVKRRKCREHLVWSSHQGSNYAARGAGSREGSR